MPSAWPSKKEMGIHHRNRASDPIQFEAHAQINTAILGLNPNPGRIKMELTRKHWPSNTKHRWSAL